MRRPRSKPGRPEDAIQGGIVDNVFKTGLREDVRYFAVPNGGYRDWRTARTLKDTGVVASIPDLVLVAPGGLAHFLEVKTADGSLDAGQREFRDWCLATGVPWGLARSRAEATEMLRHWRLLKAEYL